MPNDRSGPGTEIQVRIHERQEHWAQRTGLSVPVLENLIQVQQWRVEGRGLPAIAQMGHEDLGGRAVTKALPGQ